MSKYIVERVFRIVGTNRTFTSESAAYKYIKEFECRDTLLSIRARVKNLDFLRTDNEYVRDFLADTYKSVDKVAKSWVLSEKMAAQASVITSGNCMLSVQLPYRIEELNRKELRAIVPVIRRWCVLRLKRNAYGIRKLKNEIKELNRKYIRLVKETDKK